MVKCDLCDLITKLTVTMPPTAPSKKPAGRPKKRSKAGTAVMSNPGRPPKMNITEMSYSTKKRRAHDIAKKFDIERFSVH